MVFFSALGFLSMILEMRIYGLALALLCGVLSTNADSEGDYLLDNDDLDYTIEKRHVHPACRICISNQDLNACALCASSSDSSPYYGGAMAKRADADNDGDTAEFKQALSQYLSCECCANGDKDCCQSCGVGLNSGKQETNNQIPQYYVPGKRASYWSSRDRITPYYQSGKRSYFNRPPPFYGSFGRSEYDRINPYYVYAKRSIPSWVTPYYIYGGKRGGFRSKFPPFYEGKRSLGYNYYGKMGSTTPCKCCDWENFNAKCCLLCNSVKK